jgi:hypothetical protein
MVKVNTVVPVLPSGLSASVAVMANAVAAIVGLLALGPGEAPRRVPRTRAHGKVAK